MRWLWLLLLSVVVACDDGDPPTGAQAADAAPSGTTAEALEPTFQNVFTHILAPGCGSAGCHDANTASGGLALDDAAAAHAALFEQPVQNALALENAWLRLRPGDADRSFLWRKLTGPGVGEGMGMPSPATQLGPAWMDLVRRWIDAGAAFDEAPAQAVTDAPPLFVAREARELAFHDPIRDCISCHPNHVREWSMSNHAYAIADPVFNAMIQLGQKQTEGRLGQFCVQCHTPSGLAQGQTAVTQDPDGSYTQRLEDLDTASRRGVSCDICHSVTAVNDPRNARMVFTPDGTMRATIRDPADTPAHASTFSPLHGTSNLCGSCHNVINPAGAAIEETFDEWAASSFAGPGGKTCQGCHMPTYEGNAAVDGPRRTIHRHTFVGVDVSLLPEDEFPGYQEMRQLTAAMLRDAALLGLLTRPAENRITVLVENLAGHRLPSGATAERQMWLEVLVHDAERTLRFSSGTLDENSDLREDDAAHTVAPGTDPQLQVWRQKLYNDAGEVLYPWQATALTNHLIEPNATASVDYDFGALPAGEYTIQVRLLFRSFPPYFLRALEVDSGLDPAVKTRVPIVEMARATITIGLDGPPVGAGCPEGQVYDCNQTCQPAEWIGDGHCEDGVYSQWGAAHFACDAHAYDGGDCEAPNADPNCDAGLITDCVGACWPAHWLADSWCDDGQQQDWGDPDFRCAVHQWDHGDCPDPNDGPPTLGNSDDRTAEDCLVGFVRDCVDACHPQEWIGDGNCDDGSNSAFGSPNFLCEAHANDRGDCR
jgi:hypothetical protein